MEEFKDFFKELRERASSPLIGSFIISWCIINYDIIIAIVFNNSDILKENRYRFIYNTIADHNNLPEMLWWPLFWALIYTGTSPLIKNFIKWYSATISAKSDSAILKSTGVNSVSLTKYIEMLEAHKASQDKLEKLFASQSTTLEEVQELTNTLNDERIKNSDLQNELNSIKNQAMNNELEALRFSDIKDVSHYRGVWAYRDLSTGLFAEVAIGSKEFKFTQYGTIYRIVKLVADIEEKIVTFFLENQTPNSLGINGSPEALNAQRIFVFKYVNERELVSPDGVHDKYTLNKIGMSTLGLE